MVSVPIIVMECLPYLRVFFAGGEKRMAFSCNNSLEKGKPLQWYGRQGL